jgi:long-chain acyl-CoA synthetase
LERNAATAGSDPALIGPDQILSHKEFLEQVDKLAAGFLQRGIAKGDRVCILAQNSFEYLEIYGACAKMGAIAYPINWRLTAAEVAQVVEKADPQMLVVGAAHLPQLEGTDLSSLRVRALIGDGSAPEFIPFAELYASSASESEAVDGDDPFVIISTAAVAGVPRGAVLTHANFLAAGDLLLAALGLTAEDRHLAALPLFHITGLGLSLAVSQAGGANVVLETLDPGLAAVVMDTHKVTLMADFPPILSMLLDAREASGAQWSSLKYVLGLDAPEVIQRLLTETKAEFLTGFGQAETTGAVTQVSVTEKPGSAGQPLPGISVRCVDEDGEDVAVGEPGEIVVRGPLVFSGYWRDPDATDFASRQGWHHTGDIGKFDAEGYLYYVGRRPEKELIKSGGENVYPEEVERIIREMPQVAAVCVIGVPDKKWGEAVKAVVELASGEELTDDQIREAVVARIASYKKPQFVDFVEELPRQPDGLVDRTAVKEIYG